MIGGEAVEYFGTRGHEVIGIDNNMRKEFFGEAGDTLWNLHRIARKVPNLVHHEADIRDEQSLYHFFKTEGPFDSIIHLAGQPSHDWSAGDPLTDFSVNATGTLLLLEMTRRHSPDAVFIFMSSNKVYGNFPNTARPFSELETRYDWEPETWQGFDENTPIDQSIHSVFGCSKAAADLLVQEYGRNFGLKTTVFRGGCLSGPGHSGVKLHGFLSYLTKVALAEETYTVFGYKGKQVRDNIHSFDVVSAMDEVIKAPRCGEVYNLGGGRENSISILEAFARLEKLLDKPVLWTYNGTPRMGDHLCWVSDLSKFKSHYPNWRITKSLDDILDELLCVDFNYLCNKTWRDAGLIK